LKVYEPRIIRQMILELNDGFSEIIPDDPNIRYFQNTEVLVELRMDEEYIEDQIELICERLGLSTRDFDRFYRFTKKTV
jgi:hypothetical protein